MKLILGVWKLISTSIILASNISMISLKTLLLFVFVTAANTSFGQEQPISHTLLDTLYTRALNSRLDLMISAGHHYVELNENTNRIKPAFENSSFKFLTFGELGKISSKQKQALPLQRVVHKVIGKDTIDINFGEVLFSAKTGIYFHKKIGFHFKRNEILISCGGINGYQPDIRFVFNQKMNKWDMVRNVFEKFGTGVSP